MTVQFNFTNATSISTNGDPDALKATFWAWNMFKDLNGATFKPKQVRIKTLPTMIPYDQIGAVESLGTFAQVSLTATISGSFISSLALDGSLNLLWGMVESQQIVVHLALNDISTPGNVAFLYSYLMNIASFDPLPTDEIFELFFEFEHSEPVSA